MSKPLKTIVIATSLTDASDGVVRTGTTLARATGASPWLVHAYLPYLPLAFPSGGGVDAQWTEEQVKALQGQIAEQARRTGLSALPGFNPGQGRLIAGSAHREIAELARRVQADLIVVGATDAGRGILGSTAERLIRKAPCPVLAIRSEDVFPPNRVEIPVDLSPISANVLSQGLDFLAKLKVPLTEMEALFVLNPFEVAGSLQFTPEQIQRFAGEELRRFLAANLIESARPRAVQVRTGYPCEEILARIAERQADLAVLGTHGRGGFERLMIGSVAAEVLRSATCNLLVIPPEASAAQDTATERTEEKVGADWGYVSDEAPVAAVKASPSELPSEYWFG
jgi:nucleotide-binding universal stress UspA family protein